MPSVDLASFVPKEVGPITDHQTDLPRIARDSRLTSRIDASLRQIPTVHHLYCGDSRHLDFLASDSVQLIVTSPPYWTLKQYRDSDGQLGHVEAYDEFLTELDKVWRHCFRVLAPYPLELAERLIRMFSFVGDTVLDPFGGTGTTTLAAARVGRNSLSVEVDGEYFKLLTERLTSAASDFFSNADFVAHESARQG